MQDDSTNNKNDNDNHDDETTRTNAYCIILFYI
jgi:hypothetical protein